MSGPIHGDTRYATGGNVPDPRTAEGRLRAAAERIDAATQASLSTESIRESKSWADGKRWVPAEALADLPLPCPMRSSLTDQPCVMAWGHGPDGDRFHRFALAAEPVPVPEP